MKKLLMSAIFVLAFSTSPAFALSINFADLDEPKFIYDDQIGYTKYYLPGAPGYYVEHLTPEDMRAPEGFHERFPGNISFGWSFYLDFRMDYHGKAPGFTSITFKSDAEMTIYVYESFDNILGNNPEKIVVEAGLTVLDLSNFETLYRIRFSRPPYSEEAHLNLISMELTPQAVPVPAAVWLMGSGLAGLMVLRKRTS